MKTLSRLFLTLLALLPALAFTSCDDKNDLPDVDITLQFDGAAYVDGTLYAVAGAPFSVASIDVTNRDAGKKAGITVANYFWDYQYLGSVVEPPYAYTIDLSENVVPGRYVLTIECPVIAVDKAPATATMNVNVVVVESETDVPDNATTTPVKINPSIRDTDK